MKYNILSIACIFIIGCSAEVEPIEYGKDSCHWCQMRIMDSKFGAEAVTVKGRVYKFDSGECLLHYLQDSEIEHGHLVVTDFDAPGNFLPAQEAWFVVSPELPSPMGGFLNAFATKERAEKVAIDAAGELYIWDDMQDLYRQ